MKPTSRVEVLQLKHTMDSLLKRVGADLDVNDQKGPTQVSVFFVSLLPLNLSSILNIPIVQDSQFTRIDQARARHLQHCVPRNHSSSK